MTKQKPSENPTQNAKATTKRSRKKKQNPKQKNYQPKSEKASPQPQPKTKAPNERAQNKAKGSRQQAAGKRKPRAIIVIITRQRQQSSCLGEAVRARRGRAGRQASAYPEALWGSLPHRVGEFWLHNLKEFA